jgi:hypothetical protein
VSGTVTSADGTAAGSTTAAEAWVQEFIEGWRAPESPEACAAHFERILDPEVRLIQPQLPDLIGYDGLRNGFMAPLFALLPDVHVEVERWATRGNDVLIELIVRGTLGGRPVAWRGVDRVTLRDGLAVERETYLDPLQIFATVASRPRAWPRFVRSQASQLRHRLRKRGTSR